MADQDVQAPSVQDALSGTTPQAPPVVPSNPVMPTYDNSDEKGLNTEFPTGASKTAMWRDILTGAMQGLAGSKGATSFGGGAAGGATGVLAHKQQDVENTQRQQQIDTQAEDTQSTIRFRDAQAAALVTDAKMKDIQLQSLPQQIRDQHEAHAVSMMKDMADLGVSPTLIAPDTGKDAIAALEQYTKSHGGVPPLFTFHANGNLYSYDLSQLSETPQGLQIVNQAGAAQMRQPLTEAQFRQLPAASRTDLVNKSMNYFDPVPTKENAPVLLQQYKNNLQTMQKNPNSDPAVVTRLTRTVANLQSISDGLDKHEQDKEDRANQRKIDTEDRADERSQAKADRTAQDKALKPVHEDINMYRQAQALIKQAEAPNATPADRAYADKALAMAALRAEMAVTQHYRVTQAEINMQYNSGNLPTQWKNKYEQAMKGGFTPEVRRGMLNTIKTVAGVTRQSAVDQLGEDKVPQIDVPTSAAPKLSTAEQQQLDALKKKHGVQ
jgi:hypothetical protein